MRVVGRSARHGGVEFCVHRAWAFAPYADLIWMECAMANVEEAREFAHGVHSKFPNQMLAYNCSPRSPGTPQV